MQIYYHIRMIATVLDVSQSTLYRLAKRHQIATRTYKGESYIAKVNVSAFIKHLNNSQLEPLYSLQSIAKLLDVSPRTVRRLLRRYDLNIARVGKSIRIPESEVEKLIQYEREEGDSIAYYVDQLL